MDHGVECNAYQQVYITNSGGRLYSSWVWSSMSHGSDTWPV